MANAASAGRGKGIHGGGVASVPAGPAVGMKRSAQAAFEGEGVHISSPKIQLDLHPSPPPQSTLRSNPGEDGCAHGM